MSCSTECQVQLLEREGRASYLAALWATTTLWWLGRSLLRTRTLYLVLCERAFVSTVEPECAYDARTLLPGGRPRFLGPVEPYTSRVSHAYDPHPTTRPDDSHQPQHPFLLRSPNQSQRHLRHRAKHDLVASLSSKMCHLAKLGRRQPSPCRSAPVSQRRRGGDCGKKQRKESGAPAADGRFRFTLLLHTGNGYDGNRSRSTAASCATTRSQCSTLALAAAASLGRTSRAAATSRRHYRTERTVNINGGPSCCRL